MALEMAKLKHLFAAICFLTSFCMVNAQRYGVQYRNAVNDSVIHDPALLQDSFPTRAEATVYISKLPSLLQSKGFLAASVDSVQYDSLSAFVILYLGEQYQWTRISTRPEDAALLEAVRWPQQSFTGQVDFEKLRQWQQRILDYLEENGHPFGNHSSTRRLVNSSTRLLMGPPMADRPVGIAAPG